MTSPELRGASLPSFDASVFSQVRLDTTSTLDAVAQITGLQGDDALVWIAEALQLRIISRAEMHVALPDFIAVPLAVSQRRGCVVLNGGRDISVCVISDPFDDDLMQWLESLANIQIVYALALREDIQAYLSHHESSVKAVDSILAAAASEVQGVTHHEVLSFASVSEAASPAVKLVNSTLYDALKIGASDIHVEAVAQGVHICYRVDGVLASAARLSGVMLADQVISRLKVLSELDISEHRVPQDGSFRVQVGKREIDLRVSIMPSIHGEDAVIRILDKQAIVAKHGSLSLDALGFDAVSLTSLRSLVEEPYGMLLVTGPTGSGKTTTLYGAIAEINTGQEKIITIEDPVEYQLAGVLQIPVSEKKGLTFARGLRSILRHDPDKIMVGEIRDKETAEIAVQSALTGHLVLTTVHANNVFDVFGRFTHMGIDPYAFSSALNGIWAQRLIRVICTRCAVEHSPTSVELSKSRIGHEAALAFKFMRGQGCGDCRGTGYRGRKAIAELLLLTDEIRALITEKRPIGEMKEIARANGMRTLHDSAMALVATGETTLEESRRVTLSS